jgi:hypothetical protein
LVIWLDAPEEILIERIRSRDQWHPVKDSSTQDMRDYLFRYGSAYEHVVSELSAIREMQVLRFNTGCQAPEDITSQLLHAIAPTISSWPVRLPARAHLPVGAHSENS